MHIKSVVVCGFRSYKDETGVASFSPAQNVVIGRNGTGKSNLFDAIRFGLLTERFSNLRQDERQGLLHEGSGKHVMSAYVEITFCNKDGRLPIDTDEVVVRRTIGVKKDEFFLNRKHITKQDVHHLLESAGFSRSNPYYIVQQGKVNALALMKDQERLELLKDVAGTKVYEERREESLKIVQDTQSRREKILEVIAYIEGRLNELEEEKDELKEYQELDREKRALEYMLHEKELQDVRLQLEAIERARAQEAVNSSELHAKERDVKEHLKHCEDNIKVLSEKLADWTADKDRMEAERVELIQTKYSFEMELEALKEDVADDTTREETLKSELSAIAEQCQATEDELSAIAPQAEELENVLNNTRSTLGSLELEVDALIAKKSRTAQFKSQSDRDAYLQSEIEDLNALVARKGKEANHLQTSVTTAENTISQAKKSLQSRKDEMTDARHELDGFGRRILELKEKRNDVSETRKDKWREENNITHEVKRCTEQLARGESVLHSTMSYDVRRGLEAIKEWKTSQKFRGIHGPLIELVEPVDDRFCVALDEAAGGSYFHVVVDTDNTAARLMKELDKNKLGRVTFLPLNRLKVGDLNLPEATDDAIPLISKLKYPPEITKAVMSAFGKKLLCRDLDTCMQYAEKTGMDCLTLDGDIVQRRGGVQGGYKDPKKSRCGAMNQVRSAQLQLDEIKAEAKKIRYAAQQADQTVASVVGEIQKQESERQYALQNYEELQREYDRLSQQITIDTTNNREKASLLSKIQSEIASLVAKRSALEVELASAMQDGLNEPEAARLEAIHVQIAEVKSHERQYVAQLEDIRAKQATLEIRLTDHLRRREAEIRNQITDGTLQALQSTERKTSADMKAVDLAEATRALQRHLAVKKQLEQEIRDTEVAIVTEEMQADAFKAQLHDIVAEITGEATKAEKVLTKRRRLIQKREAAMRDIRELGTLPMSELEKFKDLSYEEVSKRFTKCSERLKGFSHVNKKALDQYVSFSEQRTSLIARKEELDTGDASIKELIEVLDRRKDEAILRTFKGVSHHFSQVFKELVPTGEGKMLILRAENASNTDTSTFVGVQIKVNFRGEGDSYLMQQLSGGQKALVALAFIFAIQRCDPAPFYLFDEIDQALDATHRAAVAALIHRQAHSEENPAQFITSTFRPELVMVADQFYGIGHQNKISTVYPMTKDESLEFIANIMADEEAVEGKATV
ncbi:chromosome segregation protein [Thraustotheca clavata]|uniref:Structural maintenance of chromosomes protein n=1 Tax=Thraustotheca clavata TaxID=74557 RepID=A0A1V9YYP7_9STRA|nr:chromosome segregation protein [Thraustotheca clavata]